MPKTKKKFNWEVYDNNGNFIDILTMDWKEAYDYKKEFPKHKIYKIEYTNND